MRILVLLLSHGAKPLVSADNKNHNKMMDVVESLTTDADGGNVKLTVNVLDVGVTRPSMRAHVRQAAAQLILQIG